MNLSVPIVAGLGIGLSLLPWLAERQRSEMDDEARRDAPGRFVKLSKGLTHYWRSDSARGPVAVLVHGLTTPSFVWDGLIPYLEELGYRVLCYDIYGRGYSDRPRGRQTPEFFCQQLSELLAVQEIEEDITLIGFSMGGAIATAFADRNPEKLRRLILLAPAGMGHRLGSLSKFAAETPLIGTWAFHVGYPAVLRRGVEYERGLPSSVPEIGDRQLAELEVKGYLRSVLSSLRGTLRRPMEAEHRRMARRSLPVLAVWGREDTVIPLRSLGKLTEWNRRALHEVVDGAGHGLPYTHPKAVADAITSAIARDPI